MNKLQAARRFVIDVAYDHGYSLCKVSTNSRRALEPTFRFWFKPIRPNGSGRRVPVLFKESDLFDPNFKQRIEEQLGEAVNL